jgi:hypothetical protein
VEAGGSGATYTFSMTGVRGHLLLALASGLVVVGLAASVSVAQSGGTTASAAARARLNGTWTFSTLTPLERPAEFAGRATMTPAEAVQFARQVMERNNADRRDGPVETDVARAYNDAWYDRGTGVAVVDGTPRTSLIVDPPDGRLPALTPEAARRQAARAQARRDHPADGPEDRSLAERCLSFNAGPPILPGPYNNYLQVFVFSDYVVVMNEMIHDARVIPTDGRPHLPERMRRFLGDSAGRWEGQTLVVDTTNFTDKTTVRGSGERMHLVERFTRTDADTLLYEFTVEDPASFTRPWRVALPMKATTEPIFEYACHEGNHALEGILRGARFGERQAATPR